MQSSNFCFSSVKDMRDKLTRELETPFYTRGYNPTVAILRKKVAALEGMEDAMIFSSGSGAVAAAVMSCVKGGDHAVCVKKPYSWTNILLTKYLAPYGVTSTFVDGADTEAYKKAIQPNTKLIYIESPNSLTFELQDIAAITAIAKQKGITTIIDNSYSSPLNQSPAAMRVDMIVHSATKYLNGHSDVVAGVVCGSKERIMKMFAEEVMTIGAIISPHDAWLMLRGLRTLELRVNRSSESCEKVLRYFEKHPKIEKVYHPFAAANPQLNLAKKQMKQGGGLISIMLRAESVEQVETFCDSLQRFIMATSWGGYESLVFPLCALKASTSFENPLPWNLVRLYIGLEDADLLIEDIDRALAKM